MSHLGRIPSQARLAFVSENNGSKYWQVVDDFPDLRMGVWMESVAFWDAVQEEGRPALQ